MKSHRSPQSEARVPSYRSEFGSFNYYPTTEFKAAVKNSTNDSQSDTEAPLLRRYHTRLAKSARGASRAASPLAAPRCSEQLGDAPLPMSNLSNPRDSGKSKNKALGVGECHRTTNISAVASEGEQSKRRTGSFPDTVPTDRGGFDGDSVGAVGTKSSEAARSSQGPASCSDPHCIHSRQSIVEFIEMQRELRKCYGIIDDLQKSLSAMEEERLGLREELTLASDRIAIHKCEMANLAAHFEAKLNFYELTSKKGVNKIDDRKNEQENSGDGIVVGETSAWRAEEWEECDQGSALGGETAIYYQQNGIRRDVGSRHGRLRVSDMSTQTLWADSSEFRSPSVAVHGGDSRPLESTLSPHSIEESKTFRGLDQAQIHPPLRTPPHEPTGDDFSTETSAHDEEIPRNRLADQSAAGMRECTSTREVQLSKSPRQNSCERSGDNTAHPASTSTVSVSASSSFDHGESLPVDTNAPTRCAWADLSIKGTEESTDERTFLHNRIQNLESQCRELVRALLMKERQFADMKTNIPTNSVHLPVSFPMSALD